MADCIIRIELPLNGDLTPDTARPGHYEMQVIGRVHLSIPVNGQQGKTYTNPVVSYASDGLSIYDNGLVNMDDNFMLCTITYSNLDITKLEEWIDSHCTFHELQQYNSCPRDNFYVSGDGYEDYSYKTHSCFAACTDWLKVMGDSSLRENIYERFTYPNGLDSEPAEYGYKNYYTWAMFKTYYPAWNFVRLKT